jgi:L-2-hydroxyglutarate oxidase LhgO
MKTGDVAKANPNLTGLNQWVEGKVFDIENNPFKGTVIAIKDNDGRIFFGPEAYFEPVYHL